MALDPLAAAWPAELARAFVWIGSPDSAMAPIRQALELDPNFAQAHDVLGLIYFVRGDLTTAAAAFERADALGWRSASFGRAMAVSAAALRIP